jgi:hypothetical protein
VRQPDHVGALRGGKPAPRLPDEDYDRAVGFLDGDRMALAIIVGKGFRHSDVAGVLAGAQHDGQTDKRSRQAERATAIEG